MAEVWGDAIKIQHSGLEMACDDNVKQQKSSRTVCVTITLKCSNHHPFNKLWIGTLFTGVRIMGIFADSLLITAHCVCRLLEIYFLQTKPSWYTTSGAYSLSRAHRLLLGGVRVFPYSNAFQQYSAFLMWCVWGLPRDCRPQPSH